MCRGELRILLFSIFGAITVMFSISAADVSLFFSGVFVPHSSTHYISSFWRYCTVLRAKCIRIYC